jgi:hypothetical protein
MGLTREPAPPGPPAQRTPIRDGDTLDAPRC